MEGGVVKLTPEQLKEIGFTRVMIPTLSLPNHIEHGERIMPMMDFKLDVDATARHASWVINVKRKPAKP